MRALEPVKASLKTGLFSGLSIWAVVNCVRTDWHPTIL